MAVHANQVAQLHADLVETIEAGGKVLVLGWRASNHDDFTRSLEDAGLAHFVREPPRDINPRDYHLMTEFVGHSAQRRIEKYAGKERVLNFVLEMGVLRTVLAALEKFLPSKPATNGTKPEKVVPEAWSVEDVEAKVPTAPIPKAQWLLQHKPQALARRTELEAELRRVVQFLERVASAETLLAQLGKV